MLLLYLILNVLMNHIYSISPSMGLQNFISHTLTLLLAPNKASKSDMAECAVCLSSLEGGAGTRVLPCLHEFHTDCMERWLSMPHFKNTCPICRYMNRYFKKLSSVDSSSVEPSLLQPQELSYEDKSKVDLENLPSDPGERPDIMSYPPNLIEQVRRAYLLKGPCQPRNHDFRPTVDGNRKRKFVSHWFDEFKDWLEYSVTKEAAFCLYCYLFSRLHGNGQDAFVSGGFTVWRKKERLRDHVGNHKSTHNRCRLACEDLMNQAQHIEVSLAKQSTQSKLDYRLRLNATIISLRYLIMQGLPFRGHDESEESLNQGNFLEFLKVISSCNEEIASVVLKNALDNLKLTSPDIQRDIINAFAVETTKAIS
ncbi:uncharacterized protein LOC121747282 [Salvia splendens]|uniref:uncharacterized protein LOC121747282 n=1 Tax=Salvia splendens TaxID=180675 RepID=UPI001C25F065|nr:uncharacterized protein LOC121747282 [Salvia splendens]